MGEPTARSLEARAADWRFLLADPSPGTVRVCGGTVLANGVAALLRARTVEPRPGEGVDLVLLGTASRRQIALAGRELREGGEVVVDAWRNVRSVRRRLTREGFVGTRAYVRFPRRSPRAWIPLTPDGRAAAHVIGMLLPGRGPGHRAARRLVAAGLRCVARTPFVSKVVVARRSCDEDVASPLVLRRLGEIDGRAREDDGPSSLLLLTGGSGDARRVIALRFVPDEARPTGVAKLPRASLEAARLVRELATRATLVGSTVRSRAPEELARWDDLAGVPAFAEAAVEGVPLTALLDLRSYEPLCDGVQDWLGEWRESVAGHVPGAVAMRAVDLVDRLDPLCGTPADRTRLAWMGEASRRLAGVTLVPVHGDLTPWNVFSAPAGLAVIDWEWASPEGLPLADITYFATTSALTVLGRRRGLDEAYRRLSTDGGRLGASFRRALARAAAAAGLDAGQAAALRALVWASHALIEPPLSSIDRESDPSGFAARSRMMRLWRVEVDLAMAPGVASPGMHRLRLLNDRG